jgi:hypothetical protein
VPPWQILDLFWTDPIKGIKRCSEPCLKIKIVFDSIDDEILYISIRKLIKTSYGGFLVAAILTSMSIAALGHPCPAGTFNVKTAFKNCYKNEKSGF